jgi:hypothetical protein
MRVLRPSSVLAGHARGNSPDQKHHVTILKESRKSACCDCLSAIFRERQKASNRHPCTMLPEEYSVWLRGQIREVKVVALAVYCPYVRPLHDERPETKNFRMCKRCCSRPSRVYLEHPDFGVMKKAREIRSKPQRCGIEQKPNSARELHRRSQP